MKKLINLSLIIALFTVATSTANAQVMKNKTACDMEMVVAWGNAACTWTGSFSAIVPANSSVNYPLPAGATLIASKGYYIGFSGCVYYVGTSCTTYPIGVYVPCTNPCGSYKAHIYGNDVVTYQ